MSIVFLKSTIFNKASVKREIGNLITKRSRLFKRERQQDMLNGPHTGRLYRRRRGKGFIRSHRASAKGQRPSPDTMTLVNAVSQKRTGDLSARVYIAEKRNPVNKMLASQYAEILQKKLGRPIITADDAAREQKEIVRVASDLIKRLT